MLDSVYHASLRFVTKSSFRTHHCSLYESVGWLSLHNIFYIIFFFLRLYCTNCLLIYVLFWLLKSLPANVIFDHMVKSCMTLHERELSLVKVLLKLSWYKLQNHLKLDYLPTMTQFKIRIKDYLSTNAHVLLLSVAGNYVEMMLNCQLSFFVKCCCCSCYCICFFELYSAVLARTPLKKRFWISMGLFPGKIKYFETLAWISQRVSHIVSWLDL